MLAKLQRQERYYQRRGAAPAAPVPVGVTKCEPSLLSVSVRESPPVSTPVTTTDGDIPTFLRRTKLDPVAQTIADDILADKENHST
jgi:hypothetical protein